MPALITTVAPNTVVSSTTIQDGQSPKKLFGRAFYESIGSPKFILAPMVDQSEFAWRLLTRSFMPKESQKSLLAYSPMFHARMFAEKAKFRDNHFEPLKSSLVSFPDGNHQANFSLSDIHLDGNPSCDRPLFVQFCANSPDDLFDAAQFVQPFCDAIDLNLGCPQGIAKRGNYGAFLQEDWETIYNLLNRLHTELQIPVTAKLRILDTKEKTLDYAKMILSAGASIITVHGRQRDQKGHNTGLADWSVIRYLRDHLPSDTVIFANGNILQHEDIETCLAVTGADGVMSAEGNLYDPSIFADPPVESGNREYWRGRDGKGGYRMDAVFRRYLDIIHKYCLQREPPIRKPLFLPSDPPEISPEVRNGFDESEGSDQDQPPRKKQKQEKVNSPNLVSMQAHLFHLLRPLVAKHHNVRDALARCRTGDIAAFEAVLQLVEEATKQGLIDYERGIEFDELPQRADEKDGGSRATVARCRRPWWICQPYVRPLPMEAIQNGALTVSKKDKAKMQQHKLLPLKSDPLDEEPEYPNSTHDPTKSTKLPNQALSCG